MLLVTGLISASLIGFALSPLLLLSLSLYLSVIHFARHCRILCNPHGSTRNWIPKSAPRFTRCSDRWMPSGRLLGGPIVAVIASVGSAVASLVTSGLLLTPALFFIRRANSQSAK
ncbi:MAG: hypothetical protein MZV63_45780 [Marinilabiliales bacterium]|nr:hypothetical protein [Marinilabiliales bacterium]